MHVFAAIYGCITIDILGLKVLLKKLTVLKRTVKITTLAEDAKTHNV
jgi:hypothetical protein